MTSLLFAALAPVLLVVQGANGADDPGLSALLSRALVANGCPTSANGSNGVLLRVTARSDGVFDIEARHQERVARDRVHVPGAHAFEQARALALDALPLVDQVSRIPRHPPADVPVDEASEEEAQVDAPLAPVAAPVVEPKVELPPDLPPVDLPAIEPPPEIPAVPPPPPEPPRPPPPPPRRIVTGGAAAPVRPKPSPWNMPASPHLGVEAGGAALSVGTEHSSWSGAGYAAVRVVIKTWELKLRGTFTSVHQDPLALFASTPLSGLQSLRIGAGFEGVIIETEARPLPPSRRPEIQEWGFSPGIVLDLEYRFTLGRFGLCPSGSISWHPPEPVRDSYPTWTALFALGVDATIW